ncbi:MAG: BrnA antitoxin family protein [Hyphomicrobiales bacterium]
MSANKNYSESNWQDPDDVPDLSTPEWQAIIAKVSVRRGRPPLDEPKISTTIRLDADIVSAFRAEGAGWQTRINDVLRSHLEQQAKSRSA